MDIHSFGNKTYTISSSLVTYPECVKDIGFGLRKFHHLHLLAHKICHFFGGVASVDPQKTRIRKSIVYESQAKQRSIE